MLPSLIPFLAIGHSILFSLLHQDFGAPVALIGRGWAAFGTRISCDAGAGLMPDIESTNTSALDARKAAFPRCENDIDWTLTIRKPYPHHTLIIPSAAEPLWHRWPQNQRSRHTAPPDGTQNCPEIFVNHTLRPTIPRQREGPMAVGRDAGPAICSAWIPGRRTCRAHAGTRS